MKRLGIDIGSTYASLAVLYSEGNDLTVTHHAYLRHEGDITGTVTHLLNDLGTFDFDVIGLTGKNMHHGGGFLDNTISQIEGARFLHPDAGNVFSVGAETFSLFFFSESGEYSDHSGNPPCASGTGSFLEQQAKRLDLSVEEFARLASSYNGKVPSIATRCSVFAKTDIIHAMQEGYTRDAVCSGICEGIARNIIDVLVKGRELSETIGLIGGVCQNGKVVEELGRILGRSISISPYGMVCGAIGAALLAEKSLKKEDVISAWAQSRERKVRDPLELSLSDYPDFESQGVSVISGIEVLREESADQLKEGCFIGIDIGSTSTKAVLLTEDGSIGAGLYTATQGQPIKAVQNLLSLMVDELGIQEETVRGIATTGSGRKLAKEIFNCDFEINEITAHARAAVELNPDTDTILEIGGQDSKFTRVKNGEVYYSVMNYVCAAGTGSFIEEQAKRLELSLAKFSDVAFGESSPFTSDRCTVYMERDLSELICEGWTKGSLAAAVLNSVRDNYLAKVVSKNPVGEYIVFQGATARNKALVAAFEMALGQPIHVSPYCHLTGAYGAALLFRDMHVEAQGDYAFDPAQLKVTNEICTLCANKCSLTVAERNGKKVGWGMKCGKEYTEPGKSSKTKKAVKQVPLPRQRLDDVMSVLNNREPEKGKQLPLIGIPQALYSVGYGPLWNHFLSSLGFSVKTVKGSGTALKEGKKIVNSDFCAPMIMSHGIAKVLLESKTDYIFYPAVLSDHGEEDPEITLIKEKKNDSFFCYYSQYFPTILNNLTSLDIKEKLISPIISMDSFSREKSGEAMAEALFPVISRAQGIPLDSEAAEGLKKDIAEKFVSSYDLFRKVQKTYAGGYARTIQPNGENAGEEKIRIALLGRPYTVFDNHLNLGVPEKLEELGAEIFFQDEFDLDSMEASYGKQFHERMHWHYGKKILKMAEFAAQERNLFPVYLTSFRCSPDAFLMTYFQEIMNHYGKPFLILQLDEHASDVGYTTRIEAGMHAFRNYLTEHPQQKESAAVTTSARDDSFDSLPVGGNVLVPAEDELICQFWADAFTRAGYNTYLIRGDEKVLNIGYRYTSGGECMPLSAIIGGAIQCIKENELEPEKTFLYLPTVCMACNFPQFPILADNAFTRAGLHGVKIGLINAISPGSSIPQNIVMKIVEGNVIGSLIYKLFYRIKPYEVHPGETKRCFDDAKKLISNGITSGGDLRTLFKEVVEMFSSIPRDESEGRRPRIGVLGDLYVRYNDVINMKIQDIVDDLGGELVLPSMTEYTFHFFDADIRLNNDNDRPYRFMRTIEGRFEKMTGDLLEDYHEPDFGECVSLMQDYGIDHYIVGETSINIGRALYFIQNRLVDALIHLNPMFCCPGVVTSSVFRKIQKDHNIPIVDIFYDGTGNPNSVLIPHLHYLKVRS